MGKNSTTFSLEILLNSIDIHLILLDKYKVKMTNDITMVKLGQNTLMSCQTPPQRILVNSEI